MQRPSEERRVLAPSHEIHRGRRFVVTRTHVGSERGSVVEKTAASAQRDAAIVAALLHEAAVLKRVEAPGVEKLVAVRTARGMPVLVVEDAGPMTLRERTRRRLRRRTRSSTWRSASRRSSPTCTSATSSIATSTRPTSCSTPETLRRSSTSTAPRQAPPSRRAGRSRRSRAGSSVYASPEQLGRTSRVVDRRSDLYSLGVVLYEVLTGAPPFRSDDPLEIVHAHLAKVPVSPTVIAAGVPRLLSGIVLKLLSKMPQARYQTAAALAADLGEARERWHRSGSIEPFELGSLDSRSRASAARTALRPRAGASRAARCGRPRRDRPGGSAPRGR